MTSRTDHNDPRKVGSFSLTYHYEMLADERRITPFATAIREFVPGKVVFESGTGTGVLSILAARSGAAHVFCTELDPAVAAFARENIRRSGCASKITLIEKSTLELTPRDLNGKNPDIVMAENLSTWQVTEPENEVMNHLRSMFGTAPRAIPGKAFNYVELCESQFTFMDTITLRTHYFEFTGIRAPRVASKPALFSTFDYGNETPTHVRREVMVTAYETGTVNSLRLTSPLEVSPGNLFTSTDSLMPPVVIPLPEDVVVAAGESLVVEIEYGTNTTWDQVRCRATNMSQGMPLSSLAR